MKFVEDDGLLMGNIGSWAERKYDLIEQYANMFSTSMKSKWDKIVYLDLFSSSGYGRIKDTDRIVMTSPLIAASVREKFDKYIFCDLKSEYLNDLNKRIIRDYPEIDAEYISGDVNYNTGIILDIISTITRGRFSLTFCLADPFKIDNLSLQTLLELSKYKIDFLVLIPSYMDAHRNEKYYIKEESALVSKFLNTDSWRDAWEKSKMNMKFGKFVVDFFNSQMESAGYLPMLNSEYVLIRNTKNTPIYYLAFYSKHPLAKKFWKNALHGTSGQQELFK